MNWLLPLLGGLGIGSLLKGVVDHFLDKWSRTDDRLYQEKRETYLGLIDALHQADVRPSMENAKAFGNWANRCKLFGSQEVIAAVQALIETSDDVKGDARKRLMRLSFQRCEKIFENKLGYFLQECDARQSSNMSTTRLAND